MQTCRLAAFICGYSTVTIVISGNYSLSNFREDLQKMYKRAGLKGEGLMFLFTDSQVVDERMLVYINDLLASGEIPDLFAQVTSCSPWKQAQCIAAAGCSKRPAVAHCPLLQLLWLCQLCSVCMIGHSHLPHWCTSAGGP